MDILPLKSDRVSLEFAAGELAKVMRGLRRYGEVAREPQTTYELLKVAGEEFLLVDEWDETSLISKSPKGDGILRSICAASKAGPDVSAKRRAGAAR